MYITSSLGFILDFCAFVPFLSLLCIVLLFFSCVCVVAVLFNLVVDSEFYCSRIEITYYYYYYYVRNFRIAFQAGL